MYSLVVFLVLLFAIVLARALEKPSGWRWAARDRGDCGAGVHALLDIPDAGTVAVFLLVQAHRRRQLPGNGACTRSTRCSPPASSSCLAADLRLPDAAHRHPVGAAVHAEVLLDTVFSWAGPASAGALLALVLLLMAFSATARGPRKTACI